MLWTGRDLVMGVGVEGERGTPPMDMNVWDLSDFVKRR